MKLILITLFIIQIDSSVIEFKQYTPGKCNALYTFRSHNGEKGNLIDSNGKYEIGDSLVIKKAIK